MKPRVMLISDNLSARHRLEQSLTQGSFQPAIIAGDWQCLDQVCDLKPDLLIIDGHRKHGDVVETLRNVRQCCVTPVLVLGHSTSANVMEMVDILEAGADFYLSPPFSHEVLVARIGTLLRRWSGVKSKSGDGQQEGGE